MKSAIQISVLVLLWMRSLIECRPRPCPLAHNILRYGPNNETVVCVHCPNCPIGQGLSYPCGSKVSHDSKIECLFCESHKTYSDEHGIGHCKQCQDCGLRNVIQECSIYQNRKCGKICPKGYVFDDNIDGCLKVKSETPMTVSTHVIKTGKLMDPIHRETTETSPKTEARDITIISNHSVEVKMSSSQPQFPSEDVDNTLSQATLPKKGNDDSPNVSSTKEVQPEQDHGTHQEFLYIFVAVVLLVLLVLTMRTVCKAGQHCSPKRPEIAEENIPLNDTGTSEGSEAISNSSSQEDLQSPAPQDKTQEQQLAQALVDVPTDNNISENEVSSNSSDAQAEDEVNLENIPEDILVSDMEHLSDENGNLFNYVQTKLDAMETCTRKTWCSIGRELKVHPDTLNLIEADRRSSTECLLEKLKTSGKELTMREFVKALKNCERNDMVRYICNWPWGEVTSPQQHQNQTKYSKQISQTAQNK